MQAAPMRIALALGLTLAACIAHADEGTTDPDFDYLPPEHLVGRMTAFFVEFLRRPAHARSYTEAKRRLYGDLGDGVTFYCDCAPDLAERTFDAGGCGYAPRNDNVRAHRVEAEHVLPASWIAAFHTGESCWVADAACGGARACCLARDARFRTAHNDLVNLVPAIGELNADRSNLAYGEIAGEPRVYGACDFEVDRRDRAVEPHPSVRGDIARIYFYMRDTYALAYPDDLAARLERWDASDPVSPGERRRNRRILGVQGTANPLVE